MFQIRTRGTDLFDIQMKICIANKINGMIHSTCFKPDEVECTIQKSRVVGEVFVLHGSLVGVQASSEGLKVVKCLGMFRGFR